MTYTPFMTTSAPSLSSTVIKRVDGWQDSSLLVPHEAIRVMLNAFEAGLHLGTTERVEAFQKLWSKWCFDFIHHHHEIEEEMYMPWINKRVASPVGLSIEHDHEKLIADMEEISRVAAERTVEAGAKLPALLKAFAAGMGAHLANEETYVPQMLRDSGYTQEEEGAMIGQVMASLPLEAFATMMPLIFYAMDKAGGYGDLTSSVFFSTLPPPVQEMFPAWADAFRAEFLDVLDTLGAPSDEATPPPALPPTTTLGASGADSSADKALIDGFRTPRVDTADLAYQADPAFLPDKAGLWKTPEAHDGWVHAHNAIRFEIGEMKRAAAALRETPLAAWQLEAVRAWWAGHAAHVHEHHSNEDDIFNPVLRTRVNYPAKLEADHTQLVEAMEAIEAHVSSGLAVGGTVSRLRTLWATYEALMLPHLYEEEQVGLPLARAYFTPSEIEKVVASFMKNGNPVSLGSFVHVMGHKKDAQAFMRENGIPPFVWHVPGKGFKALRTLYRTKMQAHIDSLLAGEPVQARTKKQQKENASKAAKAQGPAVGEQCLLSPSKRVNVLSPRFA